MGREQERPELPEGLTLNDLRFMHPKLYPVYMTSRGWEVHVQLDVGGNPARVSYSLLRTVGRDLDLDELKRKIGILDEEGNTLPGYYLGVTRAESGRNTLSRRMGISDLPDELAGMGISDLPDELAGMKLGLHATLDKPDFLLFRFDGFQIEKTMLVMHTLEEEFSPGMHPHREVEPEAIPEKPVTIFQRIRKRLSI